MSVSFGAKIIETPYLNEGIYEAGSVKNSYNLKLSEKADFVNALDLISRDPSMDTFEIKRVPGSKIEMNNVADSQITVDGNVQKCIKLFGSVSDAAQCIRNVIYFAKNRYGKYMENSYSVYAKEIENKSKILSENLQKLLEQTTGMTALSRCNAHIDYLTEMKSNGDYIAHP
jgi:hypothetical protein